MKKLHLRNLSLFSKLGIFALLAGLTFVSCDTTSNNGAGNARVTLQFQTATATKMAPGTISAQATSAETQPTNNKLSIKGSNGTLTITDIHFIVDDFELEKAEGACNNQDGKMEDGCEEFESSAFFVDLPLNNQPLNLATSSIKDGAYTQLEFEIDDLNLDEQEGQTEQQQIEALLTKVQGVFPDWPKSASMVISGSFKSNTGQITEFTTYAEAEVSVEMQLNPPLAIKDGSGNKKLTVKVNPEKWFTRSDGTVFNLANYDYSVTNKILEFETEMENGFYTTEVEED